MRTKVLYLINIIALFLQIIIFYLGTVAFMIILNMKEGTLKRIVSITNEPYNKVLDKVTELEGQGISTAEIFRRLTTRKGRPSTHVSSNPDTGDLRKGIITISKRRKF